MALILVALALVAALLPLQASPVRAQDDTAEADATLRVIHASPGAPEIDVLLDGQTLLQGLAYGTASSYATMTPEEHRVQIVPTGQTADAAVVDETIDAAPGQAYLVAVFGLLNDIGGDVYDVDLSEIEPGQCPRAPDQLLARCRRDRSARNRWRRVVRRCRPGRRLGLPRHRAGDLQRGRAR